VSTTLAGECSENFSFSPYRVIISILYTLSIQKLLSLIQVLLVMCMFKKCCQLIRSVSINSVCFNANCLLCS
jgi:hypothetical protein